MPLKGVPAVLSPDLLYILASMGHGDELVLADVHFPTTSICRSGPREIRCDGLTIPHLLSAVLKLFPLDAYVECPMAVMDRVPMDKERGLEVKCWKTYREIGQQSEDREINLEMVERFAFYERAKRAFAVVHTGDTAQYGNLILKKGVISAENVS